MQAPNEIAVSIEMLKTVTEITGQHVQVKAGDHAHSMINQGNRVTVFIEVWKREHTARTTRITGHGVRQVTFEYGVVGWLRVSDETTWLPHETYILAGENNRYLAGVN